MASKNALKIVNDIIKESKTTKIYNIGLIAESIVTSSYRKQSIEQLKKTRFLLSKIIKEKMILKNNDSKKCL